MNVRERDGVGRMSKVSGVERCKVRLDRVLNVCQGVSPITHCILKAPNLILMSSTDGGDVEEAGVSVR